MKILKHSILASIGLFLAPQALAQQPVRQITDVFTHDTAMQDVGTAVLLRQPNGILAAVNIEDSNLMAGDVYTLWVAVFNEPDQCPSGRCGSDPMDYQDPDLVGLDIGFAEGTITRIDGELHVATWVPRGALEGFPAELGETSGQGLDRIRRADIILVVRDHGPLQPDNVQDQLGTYMGGCDYSMSPLNPGSAGAEGDYACSDPYYAAFRAP